MSHFTIGTAGHIDHGKTTLIKALTDIDTDRLKEEKNRGITIDIGFAYWKSGITIIDVPGHERFIRNMVAGVQSIDFVMLVIAADDGIMPQTVEHFEIIRLLNIQDGCVVLTKCDLVDEKQRQTVIDRVMHFLKDTPFKKSRLFEVSSTTRSGIDDLRVFLEELPSHHKREIRHGLFRLFVDRSFSMKGHGAVITGTVLSGTLRPQEAVELLPVRKKLRVRGVQKHTTPVESVEAGDRAALNLAGIDKHDVSRGDVIAAPGWLNIATGFVARFFLLSSFREPLRGTKRIRILIGTMESFARTRAFDGEEIQPGTETFVSIRFDEPVHFAHGDRFIVREANSTSTIGGGIILCDQPGGAQDLASWRRFLEKLLAGAEEDKWLSYVEFAGQTTVGNVASVFAANPDDVERCLRSDPGIVFAGQDLVIEAGQWNSLLESSIGVVKQFHLRNPEAKSMPKTELRRALGLDDDTVWNHFSDTLRRHQSIADRGEGFALKSHEINLVEEDREPAVSVERLFDKCQFTPPLIDEVVAELRLSKPYALKLVRILANQGKLIKTDKRLYFHHTAVDAARRLIIDFIRVYGHIEVGQFKEKLGISRKFALSLLEFFDEERLTEREDNHRILVSKRRDL